MNRLEDNIKVSFKEIGFETVDSIHLAQNRRYWRGSYGQENETIRCIKGGELLDQLSDKQFLREDSLPLSQSDRFTAFQ
jgi:hypothetical protein